MSNRRMISRRVVETARFLRMPISSRLLYYDLCVRADDDGIVEAFPVIQQAGCTEDDLRVLCTRDFVRVLNEDLVTYIVDWLENNQLRADRKTDSIYKDLLLQVVPEAQVLERKGRADRPNSARNKDVNNAGQPRDNHGTSQGQPWDNHGTTMGPPKLSKDKLSKDNIPTPPPNTHSVDERALHEKAIAGGRAIYEANIAPVCSLIEMEKIADDVTRHGLAHFTRAVEIAVANNARKLAYIEAILHRWEVNGYDDGGRGAGNSTAGSRQSTRREDRTDWSRVKDGWGPIE